MTLQVDSWSISGRDPPRPTPTDPPGPGTKRSLGSAPNPPPERRAHVSGSDLVGPAADVGRRPSRVLAKTMDRRRRCIACGANMDLQGRQYSFLYENQWFSGSMWGLFQSVFWKRVTPGDCNQKSTGEVDSSDDPGEVEKFGNG